MLGDEPGPENAGHRENNGEGQGTRTAGARPRLGALSAFPDVGPLRRQFVHPPSDGGSAQPPAPRSADGSAPLPPESRVLHLEFSGSAGEYFRIWIVNLFFSLVTLGIFSPWAKVRKKRYFYGCTTLDGDSFDYLANPVAILKGRLVAVAVFILYALCGELYPASRFGFWIAGLVILPWLVVRATAFNARNSAWRGVRFDFTASTGAAARFYLPNLLLVVVTLGVGFPWFAARQRGFTVSHHAYGRSRLACKLSGGKFFGIYFRGGLIVTGSALLVGGLTGLSLGLEHGAHIPLAGGRFSWVMPVLFALVIYAGYGLSYAYVQTRTANMMWKNSTGPGVRFDSSLEATRLAWLYFSNIVAAACTLGLLIPWGVIRTLRYRLAHYQVMLEDERAYEANPALLNVAATGQELGDIFNIDFGL